MPRATQHPPSPPRTRTSPKEAHNSLETISRFLRRQPTPRLQTSTSPAKSNAIRRSPAGRSSPTTRVCCSSPGSPATACSATHRNTAPAMRKRRGSGAVAVIVRSRCGPDGSVRLRISILWLWLRGMYFLGGPDFFPMTSKWKRFLYGVRWLVTSGRTRGKEEDRKSCGF